MRTRSESSIRRKAANEGYFIRTIRSGPYAGELVAYDASMNIPTLGHPNYGGVEWAEAEAFVYDDQSAAF